MVTVFSILTFSVSSASACRTISAFSSVTASSASAKVAKAVSPTTYGSSAAAACFPALEPVTVRTASGLPDTIFLSGAAPDSAGCARAVSACVLPPENSSARRAARHSASVFLYFLISLPSFFFTASNSSTGCLMPDIIHYTMLSCAIPAFLQRIPSSAPWKNPLFWIKATEKPGKSKKTSIFCRLTIEITNDIKEMNTENQ